MEPIHREGDVKEGDVVKKEKSPRSTWKLGRVKELMMMVRCVEQWWLS